MAHQIPKLLGLVAIAIGLIVILTPGIVTATPPLQTESAASAGPAVNHSGKVGVRINTSDYLVPRAPGLDQRRFKSGYPFSEPELMDLKQAVKANRLTSAMRVLPQQDVSNANSVTRVSAPTPLSNSWQGPGATGWDPPDPTIAAGSNEVIATVNSSWFIYNKTGTQLYSSTLNSWFGGSIPGGTLIFSPRVLYDQHSSRWVVVAIGLNQTTSQAWWLVSVSLQSSATGSWCNYALDATLNGATVTSNWADWPGLGVDNQAIYLTANMWSFSSSTFEYAKLRILPKSSMYGCNSVSWWDFWNLKNPDDTLAFSVQPAHIYGTPGVEYLVNSYSGNGDSLTLWNLTNPLTTPSLTRSPVSVSQYVLPPDAEQPGTTQLVPTGDARLSNAIYRQGSLWTAHSASLDWGTGNRAIIRYYEINPILSTLWNQNEGGFGASSFYYYYPAITADASGNVATVFNRSGTSEYISIRYTGRLTTDPPNEMQLPTTQLRAGEATYTAGYWGYRGGIAADPNGQWFWMFHEYAGSGSVWKTWALATTYGNVSPCYYLEGVASPGVGGGIGTSPLRNCNNQTQYLPGTVVTLTGLPTGSYIFGSWKGDASGFTNPTTVTMNGNKAVIANFSFSGLLRSYFLPFLGLQSNSPTAVRLDVNNLTGVDMGLEVYDSGCGIRIMPPGLRTYCSFPAGTYKYRALLTCGPLSDQKTLSAGITVWPFECVEAGLR